MNIGLGSFIILSKDTRGSLGFDSLKIAVSELEDYLLGTDRERA